MESDLRARIKEVAVDHFNREGYHGATIRNIAKDVGCSLPMVYYYFNSKKELFHEIIKQDYFEILDRHSRQVQNKDIVEFYTQYVYTLNHLDSYDKKVYRLGVKVSLSFDGDEELSEVMDEWEKSQIPWHFQHVMPHLSDVGNWIVIIRTLIHLLDNLIETIVVKDRYLSEEAIREDIRIVLDKAR
ncbi:transcriptional regulator, TetR family [Sporobacter termitidis DSM 10068]|uniref:Transcriptional regulator, TetR family n=1 Tax=Sporobacter termitidis DSM 10068 TaxID=1123282 RepID=A0A1M5X4Z2_9FIRM|nr:TetR/AcrR family transcriptional regulator [Sporobacter termitidis]SHH94574.1 transcriptional regulator, TetR family [Sporobacter termitidis DSM 10068]